MTDKLQPIFQTRLAQTVAVLLLALAILLPRLADLDRYVTTDEVLWMYRSANFYYALGQREFEETYQKTHPGVTTMWAGSLAFLLEYPEYRGLGQGYMSDSISLEKFLDKQGKDPLEILVTARIILAFATGLILAACFWLLIKLTSFWPAWTLTGLIALEPYYVGLTQLLHVDGLLASLMLLAALAFLAYLESGERRYLALSGAAAGASWLTKTPGLFLFLYVGLLLILKQVQNKRIDWRELLGNIVQPLFIWVGAAVVVFVLFWPAMWTDPGGALQGMFGLSIDWIERGHNTVFYFNGQLDDGSGLPISYYPLSFLWRTTPVTLLGLGLAVLGVIRRWGILRKPRIRKLLLYLVLFAFFFTLAMHLGSKKADRYLIPIYPILTIAGGLGWLSVGQRWKVKGRAGMALVIVLVLGVQVQQSLVAFPYPIGYFNSLLGGPVRAQEIFTVGWGEGLDQAGRYLADKPNAEQLRVLSWYGEGSFSYYFPGTTLVLPTSKGWPDSSAKKLAQADYLVIYIHQWQRKLPQPLLDAFAPLTPEHTVWLNGLPYAQIYLVSDLPEAELQALIDQAK